MRKFFITLFTVLAVGTPMVTATAQPILQTKVAAEAPKATRNMDATASWRKELCRYQSVDKGKWTINEVHLTIHCAIIHFPVSHSTADYIADRESNFLWYARNTSSGACGIYQHLPRYWPSRVGNFNQAKPKWDLGTDCYNARSNVLVSIRMARMGGWGPWGF